MEKYMNYARANPWHAALALLVLVAATLLVIHGFGAHAFLIGPAVAVTLDEVTTEFKAATSEFRTKGDELKEAHKEVIGRMEKGETLSLELKNAIDKVMTDFNGVKGTLESLEQRLVAANDNEQKGAMSWGEQFVNAEGFKGVSSPGSKQGRISHEVKQVTSTAAGGLIRSLRENDVVNLQRERRVVRDLLNTIPVNTSSVDYAVQSTRTNNAAPVAEAAAKPYSDYAWSSATVVVRTLAHLAKITRQAMDDAPRLIGEIDSEMRYGLGYVEERQFLYGSGVGQNLLGIIPQATAFTQAAVGAPNGTYTRLDVIRLAMLQASLGLFPADGIVMSEADWAFIELTKDNNGNYLFARPQGTVGSSLWGLPVVATPAMTAGDFLVGGFKIGATVYDRMGVEVLISTENTDDFEKNLATMRAEERVAIAVKRPGAFIKGTFSTAITDLAA